MSLLSNNLKVMHATGVVFCLAVSAETLACDACKKLQPSVTRGITHGAGPDSNWDWLWITIVLAIAIYALFKSVKYLARPNEEKPNHIKYHILDERT